jgi:hypothetical protein
MTYDPFWNWRALGSTALVLKDSRSRPVRLRAKSRHRIEAERRVEKYVAQRYAQLARRKASFRQLQSTILDSRPRAQPPLWG